MSLEQQIEECLALFIIGAEDELGTGSTLTSLVVSHGMRQVLEGFHKCDSRNQAIIDGDFKK